MPPHERRWSGPPRFGHPLPNGSSRKESPSRKEAGTGLWRSPHRTAPPPGVDTQREGKMPTDSSPFAAPPGKDFFADGANQERVIPPPTTSRRRSPRDTSSPSNDWIPSVVPPATRQNMRTTPH